MSDDSTATDTVTCDECGTETSYPLWCAHSRVTCWTCDGTCHECTLDARHETRLGL